jgi:hypothetical protein
MRESKSHRGQTSGSENEAAAKPASVSQNSTPNRPRCNICRSLMSVVRVDECCGRCRAPPLVREALRLGAYLAPVQENPRDAKFAAWRKFKRDQKLKLVKK